MDSITHALNQLHQGGMILVVDDENRENEGDLVCAASMVTASQINFMARYGRGLICLALPPEQVQHLNLPLMVGRNGGDEFRTAFTYSIDARKGVTTGISAAERAHTIRLAVDPKALPEDFVSPGHIFPLQAKPKGVLERPGHTEASVDLTRLAGLTPGGVICEMMNEDGTMMRLPELKHFAHQYQLPLISIEHLIKYRLENEIKFISEAMIPTKWGIFQSRIYHDARGQEHLVLWMGDISSTIPPLVRLHSECLTGDILGSLRCDCGPQLDKALELIACEQRGLLIYLRQEGRGIGLSEKIKAYQLQEQGFDTVEANQVLGHPIDQRSYEVAVKILNDFEMHSIRLLTNNPDKITFLEQRKITVHRIPLIIEPCAHNYHYQLIKAQKLNHLIPNITEEKNHVAA
jgi:3,4-dihydroxy 2-butanone 4-phosphate synthase / GTP cyclohydrolase II